MSAPATMTPRDAIFFDRVCLHLGKRVGPDLKVTIEELTKLCGFDSKRECEAFLQLHWSAFPFCLVNLGGLFQPTEAGHINHYLAANRSRIRNVALRNRSTVRLALAAGWKRDGKTFRDRPRQMDLC